jgi:hypothetical protein
MLDFSHGWKVADLKAALADMPDDAQISAGGEVITGLALEAADDGSPLVCFETADPHDDFGL